MVSLSQEERQINGQAQDEQDDLEDFDQADDGEI